MKAQFCSVRITKRKIIFCEYMMTVETAEMTYVNPLYVVHRATRTVCSGE